MRRFSCPVERRWRFEVALQCAPWSPSQAVLLLWSEAARAALSVHWNQQVVASISGVRGGRAWELVGAASQRDGVIIHMGCPWPWAWLYARLGQRPAREARPFSNRWGWFFLILRWRVGACPRSARGSRGTISVPSIPLFSLGAASVSLALLDRRSISGAAHVCETVAASLGAVLIAARRLACVWRLVRETRRRLDT